MHQVDKISSDAQIQCIAQSKW